MVADFPAVLGISFDQSDYAYAIHVVLAEILLILFYAVSSLRLAAVVQYQENSG